MKLNTLKIKSYFLIFKYHSLSQYHSLKLYILNQTLNLGNSMFSSFIQLFQQKQSIMHIQIFGNTLLHQTFIISIIILNSNQSNTDTNQYHFHKRCSETNRNHILNHSIPWNQLAQNPILKDNCIIILIWIIIFKFMVLFATENIVKKVHADDMSRITLCCYFLWIFAIAFPILYLVSIGDSSWISNTYVLQTPTIVYKNYEISCEKNDNNILYYTNFEGKTSVGNNNPNVNGGDLLGQQMNIFFNLRDKNINSCTGIIYLAAQLSGEISTEFVGTVPFSVYAPQGFILDQISIQYDLAVNAKKSIPQSYQNNIKQNSPIKSVYSTMGQNIINSNSNNVAFVISNKRLTSKTIVSVSSTPNIFPSLSIKLNVQSQRMLISSSLLSSMRQFFRQWIYVFVPISWAVVFILKKLVQSRIYPSRTGKAIVKQKIL